MSVWSVIVGAVKVAATAAVALGLVMLCYAADAYLAFPN